jgi:predicted cation transporter
LTAIVANRLQGAPYHADFFFILRLMGPWVLPTLYGLGLYVAFAPIPSEPLTFKPERYRPEKLHVVFSRAGKVYLFVVGLLLLASGLTPMVDDLIAYLSTPALYWINITSAVLDNASIAAAEIGPHMSLKTIQYLLMGLLLSGVMLIPGNLPNMVTASKLGIKSGEWAKVGLPLGLFFMVLYFFALEFFLR